MEEENWGEKNFPTLKLFRGFFSLSISFSLSLACSDFDDGASLDGSLDNVERGSLASFGSGTTTDSENQKASAVR